MFLNQPVSPLTYSSLRLFYPDHPVNVPLVRAQCSDSESEGDEDKTQDIQAQRSTGDYFGNSVHDTGTSHNHKDHSFNPVIGNVDNLL